MTLSQSQLQQLIMFFNRGIETSPVILVCPVYQLVYSTGRQTCEKETAIPAKIWKTINDNTDRILCGNRTLSGKAIPCSLSFQVCAPHHSDESR